MDIVRNKINNAKNPLMLQVKVFDVMLYAHKVMKQFPKDEKFQLVAAIKETEKLTMHMIIDMEKKYAKKTVLQKIDTELEYMRVLVRLAYKCEYINEHRRHVWIGHIDEAGRILGGLIKHFKQNQI